MDRVYVVMWRAQLGKARGICFTDTGAPAIFATAENAELLAAKRRDEYPDVTYEVIDAVPL